MNRLKFRLGASCLVVLSSFATACSAPPDENVGETSGQAMSSSWFAQHLPSGSADEAAVLALVNDKSMSVNEYVDKCLFSLAQASAIVDYRQGDEPADAADDEIFDDVKELDRLPFTNSTFWVAAIACGRTYYKGPAGTCGTGTSTIQQAPLALEFVLDGSGSMVDDAKWPAATAALEALFTEQASRNDTSTGFGLLGFSDNKDPERNKSNKVYPTAVDVGVAPVDAGQYSALQARLTGTQPGGGTPLYQAVTGAYGYLDGLSLGGTLAQATKAVVLLTDGLPSTKKAELVTFVAANAHKAQLFAIGIGKPSVSGTGSYSPAYMGSLAVAGGTRSSSTCDPTTITNEADMCHFQVTPNAKPASQIRDELLAAIGKIRTDIAACDIGIQQLGTGALDASNVAVVIEDAGGVKVPVPASTTDGWSLDDTMTPTKVLLRGTFCDDLRANSAKRAKVEVGCK